MHWEFWIGLYICIGVISNWNFRLTSNHEPVSSASTSTVSHISPNRASIDSELPGYVGPSASNIEVDAAENARGKNWNNFQSDTRYY